MYVLGVGWYTVNVHLIKQAQGSSGQPDRNTDSGSVLYESLLFYLYFLYLQLNIIEQINVW